MLSTLSISCLFLLFCLSAFVYAASPKAEAVRPVPLVVPKELEVGKHDQKYGAEQPTAVQRSAEENLHQPWRKWLEAELEQGEGPDPSRPWMTWAPDPLDPSDKPWLKWNNEAGPTTEMMGTFSNVAAERCLKMRE
ncbi:hypothetical protein AA313_de0200685 [Arthrobotrys entomopaga]|nr:hypothetical protein AA313_de0200685 [Arthrobotrys entomopaga]